MQLKLDRLQRVVRQTVREEKTNAPLREALLKILGPSVDVSSNVERVAEAANQQLDFLEATGRRPRLGDDEMRLLVPASRSKIPALRQVAARLLPESFAARLVTDASSEVRCAAARRLPHRLVMEGVRRYPNDDQLRVISRSRRLEEAGVPNPKPVEEPFDMYGEEPLGDAVKTPKDGKLPDGWYERLAAKLCKEYGTNLEGQWEEILASNVAAAHYATSGVKIDRDKLLKAIYDCLDERDEMVLGEGSLRSIAGRLRKESLLEESMETPFMPVIEESEDPLTPLLEGNLSSSEYVTTAERLFNVRKSAVPAGIKKYRIGEGRLTETAIPVKGTVPPGATSVGVEKAMDGYVRSWNEQQSLRGEPYRLSWSPRPDDINLVGFSLELK